MEVINITGIDISHYQEGLDLSLLKDSEYRFVILKLSEGRTLADPSFDKFYSACEANGIPVGAYVYSHATNVSVATEEAVHALALLKGRKLPLGLYMDVETSGQMQIPKEQLKDTVLAFVKTVSNAGYKAGIYGSEYNVFARLSTEDFKDYSLWVAHYGHKPAIYCDLWQKTDKGSFPSWYSSVDVDEIMSDRMKRLVEAKAVPAKDPVSQTFPPNPSIKQIQYVMWDNDYWPIEEINGYKSARFFNKLREFVDDMEKI